MDPAKKKWKGSYQNSRQYNPKWEKEFSWLSKNSNGDEYCSFRNKIFPNHWCVLFSGRNTLPPLIEVFDQNGGAVKKKSIELENCHWSKVETIEPAFCININSKSHTFVAQSEQERRDWVLYLRCLTSELSEHRTQSRMPKGSGINYDGMVMEDNVLYSRTDQIFKFDVVADHNKGDCAVKNFKGMYSLAFDAQSISLLRHGTDIKVAVWTYYTIRAYGHSPHTVTFNVGTSSSTGEGMFSFLTTDGGQMIEILKQKTLNLKERNLNKTRSQANNTQPSSPTTAAKPPVFPKTTQVSTSSSASAKSNGTNSASGIAVQNSVKRKPAPLAPSSSNAQASTEAASLGPSFINELNQSLANPSSPTPTTENNHKSLSMAASLDSLSSTSSSKKERKKQKELRKQEKKAAKEEAKREKELEKAFKKATKKNNRSKKEESSSSVATASEFDQSHIYAQANEDYISIDHTESVERLQGSYAYSDVDIQKSEMESAEAQYAAPWKDLLSSPPAYPPIEEENVYATPQKCEKNPRRKLDVSQGDEYEDLDVQNAPPPEIPKRADENDEALNNNIYDHFHQPAKKDENPENVYGMESASAPLSSMKKSQNVSGHGKVKQEKTDTDDYEYI